MKQKSSPAVLWTLCLLLAALPFDRTTAQSKAYDLYIEARELFHNHDHDLALSTLQESLRRRKTPEAFYLEALIYDETKRGMQAISSLTNVIEMQADHLDAYFKRGELYYREGIYMQALKDFDFILEYDGPAETNAIYFKVDPNQQEQVQVVTLVSMQQQVYGLRGLVYQAIGEYDKALSDLSYAIALDSSAQNHVNRALLFMELNRKEDARRDLLTATSLSPDLVIAWYNLLLVDQNVEIPESIMNDIEFIPMISYQAVEALQKEEYELAQSLFTRALMINPYDALLLLNAGRLSYKLENYDEAIGFYKKALEIESSRFEVYYLIGNSFFQKKDYAQAAAYYEQFLARDRSDGNVWYNAALTYLELEDNLRACECLKNAMDRGMAVSPRLLRDCNQ